MGTYTTNYNLFMPTVGETGWGTLVNTNFSTIDSTMKGLNTRLTAVENEVNGNLSCTSVTTSGKITGNGGIAGTTGTFSGAVTGASFNGLVLRKGTITVTPSTEFVHAYLFSYSREYPICILPMIAGIKYSGRIQYRSTQTGSDSAFFIWDSKQTDYNRSFPLASEGTLTYSFTNIDYLYMWGTSSVFTVSKPIFS